MDSFRGSFWNVSVFVPLKPFISHSWVHPESNCHSWYSQIETEVNGVWQLKEIIQNPKYHFDSVMKWKGLWIRFKLESINYVTSITLRIKNRFGLLDFSSQKRIWRWNRPLSSISSFIMILGTLHQSRFFQKRNDKFFLWKIDNGIHWSDLCSSG